MTTATMEKEKSVKTGNVILDMELPFLTENELEKLADYAKFLRWSREEDDDDDSWADAPLTPEEEEEVRRGREEFARGEYLSLEEFMEGL